MKISRMFIPRSPINDIPSPVQIMSWRLPLSESIMVQFGDAIYASLGLNVLGIKATARILFTRKEGLCALRVDLNL